MSVLMRKSIGRTVIAAIIALVAIRTAMAQATRSGKPIPNGPEAKTDAQFRESYFQYYLQLAHAYRDHTHDALELKPLGIELLTEVARKRTLESSGVDVSKIHQLAQQLFDRGSRDPLVVQRLARMEIVAGKFDASIERLLECEMAWDASEYPPLAPLLNSYYLCLAARSINNSRLLQEQFPRFTTRLCAWLAEESKTPENRRYLYAMVRDLKADFTVGNQQSEMMRAMLAEQGLDAWVRDMLDGEHELAMAWESRGGDVAARVTRQGRQGFTEHLARARERLVRAWKAYPELPEAPAAMIEVAKAGGDDNSPREWFDRTVAAQMDFARAYDSLRDSLLPRWGGSHQEMYKFGLECLATRRFDTDVPLRLFWMLQAIEQEVGRQGRTWSNPKVYSQLREAFEGLENDPAHADDRHPANSRTGILSLHAGVAIQVGQWDDARNVLEALDGQLSPLAVSMFSISPRSVSRVFALSSEVKHLVLQAEDANGKDEASAADIARALASLAEAREKNTDTRATPYLDAQAESLQQRHDYFSGKWVELKFDPQLLQWEVVAGKWRAEDERSIIGQSVPTNSEPPFTSVTINAINRFPPPFEFHADIDDVENRNGMLACGLLVGDITFYEHLVADGRLFWVSHTAFGANTGLGTAGTRYPHRPRDHVEVRVWPTSFAMSVNGSGQLLTHGPPFRPGRRVGIGSHLPATLPGPVRFANVRIRRLPYGPLAPLADPIAQIEHGTKMVEHDPDDWYAHVERGLGFYGTERWDDALAAFRTGETLRPESTLTPYLVALALVKQSQFAEAFAALKRALAIYPNDPASLRQLAELELTCDDLRLRNPQAALLHAQQAVLEMRETPSLWEFQETVALAHAELGDFATAVQLAEELCGYAPPEGAAEAQQFLESIRDRRRKSFRGAVSSLLWEGDMTRRIIGGSLALVLLAANLILMRRFYKFGTVAGLFVGGLGAGASVAVPAVLAVVFQVGEGPAFWKLLAMIVAVAAMAGAICGAIAGRRESRRIAIAVPVTTPLAADP